MNYELISEIVRRKQDKESIDKILEEKIQEIENLKEEVENQKKNCK